MPIVNSKAIKSLAYDTVESLLGNSTNNRDNGLNLLSRRGFFPTGGGATHSFIGDSNSSRRANGAAYAYQVQRDSASTNKRKRISKSKTKRCFGK